MYKKSLLSVAIATTLLTGCLDSENREVNNEADDSVRAAPATTQIIFNPGTFEFPIPIDALVDTTDGTYQANSAAPVLDFLDGGSTTAPILIPLTGSVNPSTVDGTAFIPHPDPAQGGVLIPNPTQNVFLLDLTFPGGDDLVNVDGEIPTFQAGIIYTQYLAAFTAWATALAIDPFDPDLPTLEATRDALEAALLDSVNYRVEVVSVDGGTDNAINVVPLGPLSAESKYIAIVTDGILDSDGDNITASDSYEFINNADRSEFDSIDSTNADLLAATWDAIQLWEQLSTGWFDATTNASRTDPSVGLPALDETNIAISFTFTTAGVDTVLKAMAAPETFFAKTLTTEARQDGITALLDGTISILPTLDAMDPSTIPANTLDAFFQGLTTDTSSPLYIAGIADGTYTSYAALGAAVAAGTLSTTELYKAQEAAATANLSTENGDTLPGADDGAVIGATAAGTVTAINTTIPGALFRPASGITDKETTLTPGATTLFDTFIPIANPLDPATPASYLLPSQAGLTLPNPGFVMQGQIDVPYFLPDASATGNPAELVEGTWEANTAASAAGVTPPSDKVTYRFPLAENMGTETIPFMLSIPDPDGNGVLAASEIPAGGLPVVIYQHGIFGSRGHSLPIANGLGAGCIGANATNVEFVDLAGQDAPRCFATIAIDLPLHGLAPATVLGTADSLTQGGLNVDVDGFASGHMPIDWSPTHYAGLHERHFGFSRTALGAPTPMIYDSTNITVDDAIGSSGEFFINLAQPAGSRDNLRQAVMDLLTLNASLGDIDINGDGVGDLNTSRVYFVGHSLGGIVGTTFAAINNDADVQTYTPALPELHAISLQTTGGQISRILENSPSLSTEILAGLSAASNGVLVPESSSLEIFLNTAQAAIDSADSINFASAVADLDLPVLTTEIYGTDDGSGSEMDQSSQDQTIPIGADSSDGDYFAPRGQAFNAPLAGTEPLLSELGLTTINLTTADPAIGFYQPGGDVNAAIRFNTGSHTSIVTGALEGADSGTVQSEIGTQLVTFFSAQGQEVAIGAAGPATISAADPDVSN